jgi:hypothetical protein
MKNTILIDMDTDREEVVKFSKPEQSLDLENEEVAREMVLNDLTTLCNALGTLIHLAHHNNYLSSDKSCKLCIDFLNTNFNTKDE